MLGSVQLSKYFSEFRRREVRMEELKLLSEDDLKEARELRIQQEDGMTSVRRKPGSNHVGIPGSNG